MPRHIKSKASPKVQPRPKAAGSCKVKRVAVTTASLIQIDPDDELWTGEPCDGPDADVVNGSIVKLQAPPGTAASLLLTVERMFYEQGAKSVKAMPVQDEVKVTVEGEEFDFTEHDDERPLRQVVMERAGRVTSSHDQPALERLVAKAMDHGESQT